MGILKPFKLLRLYAQCHHEDDSCSSHTTSPSTSTVPSTSTSPSLRSSMGDSLREPVDHVHHLSPSCAQRLSVQTPGLKCSKHKRRHSEPISASAVAVLGALNKRLHEKSTQCSTLARVIKEEIQCTIPSSSSPSPSVHSDPPLEFPLSATSASLDSFAFMTSNVQPRAQRERVASLYSFSSDMDSASQSYISVNSRTRRPIVWSTIERDEPRFERPVSSLGMYSNRPRSMRPSSVHWKTA